MNEYGLIGRVGGHHNVPWSSRDYHLEVSCAYERCPANRGGFCSMPSAIAIGADGKCATGQDLIKLDQKSKVSRKIDGD